MSISIAGIITCLILFIIGNFLSAPLVIGLFASLPFAATAIISLPALGGSSPLIYTVFTLAFLASIAFKKGFIRKLGIIFARYPVSWLLLTLLIYVLLGAYLLPRFFLGQTNALIPITGVVTEVPLAPVSGNITQTSYYILGSLAFFGFAIFLLKRDNFVKITRGFFAFAIAHTALGWIDLGSKLVGAGDILAPVRSAGYALLTSEGMSGFWRVVGGGSEASSFAVVGLGCLGFTYSYWHESRSMTAFILTLLMLLLLLLSTSSTAYVGLGILSLAAAISLSWTMLKGRFKPHDILLLTMLILLCTAILTIFLYDQRVFTPFVNLFQTMVLEKADSASGQERSYWNMVSLQAFFDTFGLGIGLGSSRSSSWAVSTIAQLGIVGSLMILVMIGIIARGMSGLPQRPGTQQFFALCSGARACTLSMLMAESVAGSGADPGIMFFISLAVVVSCRMIVAEDRAYGNKPILQAGRGFSAYGA